MLRNLMMNDLIMGEAYIMFLVSKGYSRQDAHEIVRKSSMEARKNKTRLIDEVRKVTNLNVPEANPLDYIGNSIEIVDKILEIYESHSNKYHSN
jgi:Adenylosuccinate lyase